MLRRPDAEPIRWIEADGRPRGVGNGFTLNARVSPESLANAIDSINDNAFVPGSLEQQVDRLNRRRDMDIETIINRPAAGPGPIPPRVDVEVEVRSPGEALEQVADAQRDAVAANEVARFDEPVLTAYEQEALREMARSERRVTRDGRTDGLVYSGGLLIDARDITPSILSRINTNRITLGLPPMPPGGLGLTEQPPTLPDDPDDLTNIEPIGGQQRDRFEEEDDDDGRDIPF